MSQETLGEVWDMSGTLKEVRDGSVDPQGGSGWVRGPSRRSSMGRETLRKVWDGTEYTWGGPGRVGGPSGRPGTGRGTLRKV